jgi:hypothetical protein
MVEEHMARESTDMVQVKIRIPERLRVEVLMAAQASGRSLNGELSHLIEEGLARRDTDALIKSAVLAASGATAARIQELLAPYLDRLAQGNATSANPTSPPPDLAQLAEAMGRAAATAIEATREKIEARREKNAAQVMVRETIAAQDDLPLSFAPFGSPPPKTPR